jgi:hypothetical protein
MTIPENPVNPANPAKAMNPANPTNPMKTAVSTATLSSVNQSSPCPEQGCQMVCFQAKNPSLGQFWRALEKCLYTYVLWPFGIFYGYSGYFMTIWYILFSFGTFFRFWYHAPNLATLLLICIIFLWLN